MGAGAPITAPAAKAPAQPVSSTDRTIIKATLQDGTFKSFELPGTLDDESIAMATSQLVEQLGGVQSIQAFTPGRLAKPAEQPYVQFPAQISGQPGHMADVMAGAVPESLAGTMRGAVDRFVEPQARVAGLLSGGVLGLEPQGAAQTGADLLATGFNLTPAGIPLAMRGVGTQALAELLGAEPNTARVLSAGVEVGSGLVQAYKGVRAGFRGKPGAKIIEEATTTAKAGAKPTPGVARMTPKEAAGFNLQTVVLDKINHMAKIHGKRLDDVETFIKAHRPKIRPEDADYESLQKLVSQAMSDDIVSLLPGPVKKLVQNMNRAMAHTKLDPTTKKLIPDPLPISMEDLVSIRRIMGRQGTGAHVLDKAAKKLAGGFRKEVTDIIETGAGRQDLQAEFAAARLSYLKEVIEPKQLLSKVIRRNVTPQQAFNSIYNGKDSATFRALHDYVGRIPGVRDKLRLGFAESLGDLAGDFEAMQKAASTFDSMRIPLASTGLYSADEITVMGRALTAKSIPSMVQRFQGGITRLAEKGGPGNALLGTLAILRPQALVSVLMASGTVGAMRKLQLTTIGSMREKQIMGLIVTRVTQMATRLNASEHANLEIANAPDDESMPTIGRGVVVD